ncbi:SEFIR domain-containing protein, partial [Actinosynnema sp. NPDC020468]|uniref:SEFIR domain-containing protein n=1 Tax=Actinosynnema sp. NPDC020468 TaxID=3154488 RepID=UPI0034041E28
MPPPRSPRVFVSYADDSGAHTDAVVAFAERLRAGFGIDVRLDVWARDRRRDWVQWVVEQIEKGDFVLAIASPEYRRRAGSDAPAGGGLQFQYAMLRDRLAQDRTQWLPKILPVVLEGHRADDLPTFLQPYSASRYTLPDELEELLRVLTGQPRHPVPGLAPLADPAVAARDELFRTTPIGPQLSAELAEAAERLAGAVTDVWRAEVKRLGLDDPRPLATRWSADGVEVDRIGPYFRRHVPDRRLLVLGEPGSGKSVSAIRLVSDVLATRASGDPVPVLVPVTDWNPREEHPFDWLAGRLARDHRLGRTVRWVDGRRITLATALLEAGRVLPVLDGLETVADDLRVEAVEALNRLGSSFPLVVTCGVAQYRDLEAKGVGLARARRADLLPLDRADVESYLTETVPHGASRLPPLFARLRAEPDPTPLVVWLLRVVHRDVDRDPADLCDRTRFPDPAAIEAHLLAHLVPAVYPDHPTRSSAGPHHTTVQRWLGTLATHLEATGSPDLAWWRLHRALPWAAPGCRALAGAALGFGAGSAGGPVPGLIGAAVVGLAATSTRYLAYFAVGDLETPHALTVSRPRLRAELVDTARLTLNTLLLLVGVFALLVAAVGIAEGPSWTVRSVLVLAGLVLGGGLLTCWTGRRFWLRLRHGHTGGVVGPADLARPTNPETTLRADRRVVLLGSGIMLAVAAGFAVPGVDYAVRIALGYAGGWLLSSAHTRFTVTRLVLAARGRLPWRLMPFLTDARDRGVLRQYGAVHQFRHRHLHRHLLDRVRDAARTPRRGGGPPGPPGGGG